MKRNRLFIASLMAATALIAWFALPYHPAYQEWRCKDSSLEKLQSLQAQMPENPILLYYLGLRLRETRRSEEAITILQRGAALDLDDARIRNALAEAQMSLGRTRETYQVVRQFYETHPANVEASLMMARFYLTTKSFAPASTLLNEATRQFPQNAECFALLAIAQQRLNDTGRAENSVAMATRLRPQESKYWFLQAQILKQAKKTAARAAYEKALQLSPDDVQVQADFADYLARAADFPAAEKWARSALGKSPDDLRASGALGIVLAERSDPSAFALLRKGLQNDRRDVLVLRSLQRLSARTGRPEEAKQWLEEAVRVQAALQEERDVNVKLEQNPDSPELLRQMALLMARNGDYLRCMQYHARAMRQVADASAPLLAAANDLNREGFPALARRLAEQSLKNSKTPQERREAEAFLDR